MMIFESMYHRDTIEMIHIDEIMIDISNVGIHIREMIHTDISHQHLSESRTSHFRVMDIVRQRSVHRSYVMQSIVSIHLIMMSIDLISNPMDIHPINQLRVDSLLRVALANSRLDRDDLSVSHLHRLKMLILSDHCVRQQMLHIDRVNRARLHMVRSPISTHHLHQMNLLVKQYRMDTIQRCIVSIASIFLEIIVTHFS